MNIKKMSMERKGKLTGLKGREWRAGICAACAFAFMFVLMLAVSESNALTLKRDSDWLIKWDNTLKYSMGFRVVGQDPDLIDDPSTDDCDRNFDKGVTSTRWDILSEFDATFRNKFGVRVSGAGWVDAMYLSKNDNDSAATFSGFGKHNKFDNETKRLHGKAIELLDAFVFGNGQVACKPASFKLGRHTLLWGESLFFGSNGIMYAMAPMDLVKGISVPSTQAKELFMPIARFSGQIQLMDNVTLAGFANFEWRRNRYPGAGSYYDDADVYDAGGRRFLLGPDNMGPALWRGKDIGGGDKNGAFGEANFDAFGTALRFRVPCVDVDWGLYYHRFNDTSPQIYTYIGKNADMTKGKLGEYYLVFPKHTHSFGASFSTQIGEVQVGGEVSGRANMPLISGGQGSGQRDMSEVPQADNNHHPLYAVGNTIHANISAMYTLPTGPTIAGFKVYDGGMLLSEIAWHQLLHVTENKSARMLGRDNHAVQFRVVFDPAWYQVLPGLDLDMPLVIGYNPSGTSPTDMPCREDSGDAGIGLNFIYRTVWKGGINYTNYFGPTSKQYLADRDNISLTVQYSF